MSKYHFKITHSFFSLKTKKFRIGNKIDNLLTRIAHYIFISEKKEYYFSILPYHLVDCFICLCVKWIWMCFHFFVIFNFKCCEFCVSIMHNSRIIESIEYWQMNVFRLTCHLWRNGFELIFCSYADSGYQNILLKEQENLSFFLFRRKTNYKCQQSPSNFITKRNVITLHQIMIITFVFTSFHGLTLCYLRTFRLQVN